MPDAPPLPDPIIRNAHWWTWQFFCQSVYGFCLQYRARGMEHLPENGGALLLINHQSYLDPHMVGLPLQRPVSFLARDDLFRVPFVGWVLRNTYVIPISRESASTSGLREAIRRLEHGFYVGIFPEGTRCTTGAVEQLKPGFLLLLRRTTVPVIPVGIAGTFEVYPKGAWFPQPGSVRVVFGEPFDREYLMSFDKNREADLLAHVREGIVKCHTEAEAWRLESSR
jgi:1-acyl-sn-glycerol-3-phosphate acyltransferase